MRTAVSFLVVALVALGLTLLPGGEATLNVLLTVLTLAFFVGIALFGVSLYRQNRLALDSLTTAQRAVLYGAVGLAFLTFTATRRLFDAGGLGLLVWFLLLAMASYGAFWAYSQSRRYG